MWSTLRNLFGKKSEDSDESDQTPSGTDLSSSSDTTTTSGSRCAAGSDSMDDLFTPDFSSIESTPLSVLSSLVRTVNPIPAGAPRPRVPTRVTADQARSRLYRKRDARSHPSSMAPPLQHASFRPREPNSLDMSTILRMPPEGIDPNAYVGEDRRTERDGPNYKLQVANAVESLTRGEYVHRLRWYAFTKSDEANMSDSRKAYRNSMLKRREQWIRDAAKKHNTISA